jgi:hypothetical protein
LLSLVLLFLLASAALPERVPEAGLDLREAYVANVFTFWLLLAGYLLSAFVFRGTWFPFEPLGAGAFVVGILPMLFLASLAVGLAFSTRRLMRALAVPLCLFLILAQQLTRQPGPA